MIFDPLKSKIIEKDLKPYNSVAFYFGCDLSLYVSFLINMTSFLLILGIFGIAVFVLKLFLSDTWDLILNSVYVLIIMIWMILMNIKWE